MSDNEQPPKSDEEKAREELAEVLGETILYLPLAALLRSVRQEIQELQEENEVLWERLGRQAGRCAILQEWVESRQAEDARDDDDQAPSILQANPGNQSVGPPGRPSANQRATTSRSARRFSQRATNILESEYGTNRYPSTTDIENIAGQVELRRSQIRSWFASARSRRQHAVRGTKNESGPSNKTETMTPTKTASPRELAKIEEERNEDVDMEDKNLDDHQGERDGKSEGGE